MSAYLLTRLLLSPNTPSYVIETPDKLPYTLTLTNKSVNSCSSLSTSSASHITNARSKTHLTHRQTPQRAHETSIPCRRQTLDSPCKDISIHTPRTVVQSLPALTSLSLLETCIKRRGNPNLLRAQSPSVCECLHVFCSLPTRQVMLLKPI